VAPWSQPPPVDGSGYVEARGAAIRVYERQVIYADAESVLCRKRHARLDCARRRDFPDLHAGRFAPVFERQ